MNSTLYSRNELCIGVYPKAVLTDLALVWDEKVLLETTEGAPLCFLLLDLVFSD